MTSDKIQDIIELNIQRRLSSRANLLFLKLCVSSLSEKIWIAGNSLNAGECHDIDVFFPKKGYGLGGYCVEEIDLDELENCIDEYNKEFSEKMGKCEILHTSQNAITAEFKGVKYQFCKYQKETIQELVESFDYAHIQIGCVVDFEEDGEENEPKVDEAYYTDAYIEALLTHRTWYVGSDYPLGSLFRAEKYKRYGEMHSGEYKKSVVKALTDLIRRGYKDYQDFKDSIGAIDLLLFDRSTSDCLFHYFEACAERGLVASIKTGDEEKLEQWQFESMMNDEEFQDPNINQEKTLDLEDLFAPPKEESKEEDKE
jgi:hypothetical protein